MNRAHLPVIGILLAGNALVWVPWLIEDHTRWFDFAAFHDRVKIIFDDPTLESFRFEEEGLLPQDYAYYESTDRPGGLLSVYVGYYPRKGLLAGKPHDPTVCYPSFGWEIEGGPESVELADPQGAIFASRILVQSQGERRIVLYWLQRSDGLPREPAGGPSWYGEIRDRLGTGRTDRAWIRLELDPARVEFPLDGVWQDRVHRTMVAALRSLR